VVPGIARAVGDLIKVLPDGGVRGGGDVVNVLSLGAPAVMVGRAYLWGLAANGQAGVENGSDILREGIDCALHGPGHSSIADPNPNAPVFPPAFHRRLGTTDTEVTHNFER
jgi:isopentenyl diphosphate isomerase/L-lactate dehydrogenase-like FMN-dependent dehydrogenase